MKNAPKPGARTFEEKLRSFAEAEPDFRARHTLAELGEMIGVSRQRVYQVVGPYRGPRKKVNRQPRPDARTARLRALEAAEPDFRERYTPSELARKFGVSRQHVSKVLGPLHRDAGAVKAERARQKLREFAVARPDAVGPTWAGGMPMAEIAGLLDLSPYMLTKCWGELKLPPREPPRGGGRRVLREETCVECGRRFEWTLQRERNLRYGVKKYVVCGVLCGTRQGRRAAERRAGGRARRRTIP